MQQQQKKKKKQHLSKESRKQTVRRDEPTTTFKNSEEKIHHLEDTIKEVVLKQQEVVESRETEERMNAKKKQRRHFTSFVTGDANVGADGKAGRVTKKAKKGGSEGGEESVRMLGRQLTFSPVSLPASTHAASPSSLLHPKKPVRADALAAQPGLLLVASSTGEPEFKRAAVREFCGIYLNR